MKLDDYAIQQLAPYMTGHTDHGANFTGRELMAQRKFLVGKF